MDSKFKYMRVPREFVGDDVAILEEWLVADGVRVEEGELICTVEMSKATVELEAPQAGWLFHLCQVKDEIAVGRPVGMIADSPNRPSHSGSISQADSGPKITRRAQDLIDLHGLSLDQFEGIDFVRERDVLEMIQPQDRAQSVVPDSEARAISAVQRRVAQTVSESSATIPHSYLSCWLPVISCEERLRTLSEAADILASVSDLLVYSVARAAEAMPKANAAWSGTEISQYLVVNVGFALNLAGGDLVVPVIRAANKLEFEQIVAQIRSAQVKARRRKLTPADFAGGTLSVTSLTGSGAQQVLPIIVPGQSVILSIADPAGGPAGTFYCLTIGFDHRVLNGTEAAKFLAHVADGMTKGEL